MLLKNIQYILCHVKKVKDSINKMNISAVACWNLQLATFLPFFFTWKQHFIYKTIQYINRGWEIIKDDKQNKE